MHRLPQCSPNPASTRRFWQLSRRAVAVRRDGKGSACLKSRRPQTCITHGISGTSCPTTPNWGHLGGGRGGGGGGSPRFHRDRPWRARFPRRCARCASMIHPELVRVSFAFRPSNDFQGWGVPVRCLMGLGGVLAEKVGGGEGREGGGRGRGSSTERCLSACCSGVSGRPDAAIGPDAIRARAERGRLPDDVGVPRKATMDAAGRPRLFPATRLLSSTTGRNRAARLQRTSGGDRNRAPKERVHRGGEELRANHAANIAWPIPFPGIGARLPRDRCLQAWPAT